MNGRDQRAALLNSRISPALNRSGVLSGVAVEQPDVGMISARSVRNQAILGRSPSATHRSVDAAFGLHQRVAGLRVRCTLIRPTFDS